MDPRQYVPIEEMDLFRRYLEIGDWVWETVCQWRPLALDTVGKQLIRAIDSVGANLVEGDGRYSDADAVHFFIIARASARETRYWLERAVRRKLITADQGDRQIAALASATRQLNQLIKYRRSKPTKRARVAEPTASYEVTDRQIASVCQTDPFTER